MIPIFGQTFACACGQTHVIEPREIVYADDALERLPRVLGGLISKRRVTVLMDARTRAAAGAEAAAVLAGNGWRVLEIIVPDPPAAAGGTPVCDDLTQQRLAPQIGTPDIILTVGSGVIGDLGKWLAGDAGLPFASFATAASMNGYASANVAPAIAGVKTLVAARPPLAVLSSPAILGAAPYRLTAAGLGDVLGKSVSSADWRLNQILFDDYYCEKSVGLIAAIEPLYLEHPEDLRGGKDQALEALFQALLLTGAAMTMAATSAPASGGEHLISHALDLMSTLDGHPHDLHGRQVGVGTILAAALYQRLLALESPAFTTPTAGVDERFWGSGGLSAVVKSHYAEKMERLRQAGEKLKRGHAWDQLRASLAPLLRPPAAIRDCLRRGGAAYRAEDLGCGRERLLDAFRRAHEIRARFTVLDLARLAGVMPAAAENLVESWA